MSSMIDTLKEMQKNWDLSSTQMAELSHVSETAYLEWLTRSASVAGPTVPTGMETAVPLVSIYVRLARHFKKTEEQIQWMTSPNKDFGGNKPLDIIRSSKENAAWLGYYLDSVLSQGASSETDPA